MISGTYQSQESESTTAHSNQQRAEHASAFEVEDHRPEAVAQRKLQKTILNSPRVKQLRAYQELTDTGSRENQLRADHVAQLKEKPNNTGLPDQLKSGIETLGGISMDHVKVHYNSGKPSQLNAHAYAQGSDIHLAPGQERHLPHEAWHVVQQAKGRVKPTMQLKAGVPVNDDAGLEKEADVMGAKAHTLGQTPLQRKENPSGQKEQIVQMVSGPGVVQRAARMIGGGVAKLHEPDDAVTTASVFSHGVYNNDIDVIDDMALGYYCPHQSLLNSNLTMMRLDTLYPAATGAPDNKWHNYTLNVADIGLSDEEATTRCNESHSALAEIKEATSTSAIVALLKAEDYNTIKAIHCREVNGADNQEWDPVANQAIVVEVPRVTVTRISLNGKWDTGGEQITAQTDVAVDFVFMDAENDYPSAKRVVEIDGENLSVENC
jgi:hypothetical protein